MKTINIGLLGLGTIGSGVVKLFQEHPDLLDRRVGAKLRIKKIAEVGTPKIPVDAKLLTKDAMEVIKDPQIDIIVELIGGTTLAKTLCLEAVANGKHLVTANKALLGEHGLEIYRAAAEKRVDLGFEASVCGAIPIIRSVKEGLVANRILSIMGIVNGTTNYILTKMTETGQAFASVLAEAQAKGYAEADPTLDVGGSTPRTSCRSWPRWPTAGTSASRTSTSRASRRSRRWTSRSPASWGTASSSWRSPNRSRASWRYGYTPP